MLRVFIQNPESGEPWAYCGDVDKDWQKLATALGHFTQAEVENAAGNGEREISINIKLVRMTDAEVAAMPDI